MHPGCFENAFKLVYIWPHSFDSVKANVSWGHHERRPTKRVTMLFVLHKNLFESVKSKLFIKSPSQDGFPQRYRLSALQFADWSANLRLILETILSSSNELLIFLCPPQKNPKFCLQSIENTVFTYPRSGSKKGKKLLCNIQRNHHFILFLWSYKKQKYWTDNVTECNNSSN